MRTNEQIITSFVVWTVDVWLGAVTVMVIIAAATR